MGGENYGNKRTSGLDFGKSSFGDRSGRTVNAVEWSSRNGR